MHARGAGGGRREHAFIDLGVGSLGETAGATGNATRVGGYSPPRKCNKVGGYLLPGGALGGHLMQYCIFGVPTTPPPLKEGG